MTEGNRDQMLLAIGRLEGKVDSLIHNQRGADERAQLQDSRIQKLENARAWVMGVSAAVGVAASAASRLFFN